MTTIKNFLLYRMLCWHRLRVELESFAFMVVALLLMPFLMVAYVINKMDKRRVQKAIIRKRLTPR